MYNLTEKEQKEVQNISHKIADRMETMYLEKARKEKLSTLEVAASIAEGLGEVHLAEEIRFITKNL